MRLLYSLFLYLLSPLIVVRLLWRARRQPAYLAHWGERLGVYRSRPAGPLIWVHAVSVGETRAAEPLLRALQAAWPGCRVLLTGMTPTGRETARSIFGETVTLAYLPYDFPGAVDRFFRHFRPVCGLLMETEIWPNLLAGARRHGIPVSLVNARLSARSARGYGRFSRLVGPAFASLTRVAAQTAADAERLRMLGAVDVRVCGNLKFDVTPSPSLLAQGAAWRAAMGARPVFLAASTREGEEALLLAAWQAATLPAGALLVLVPRHPQRFAEVAEQLGRSGLAWGRRSESLPNPATAVWLGDSMGEMAAYYALADLAYIGGSLLPFGGQNLIEAAACACPVLVGPHTFNFLQATEDAIAAGAAGRVEDAGELMAVAAGLLADGERRAAMAAQARAFAEAHRGATGRIVELIGEVMPAGV